MRFTVALALLVLAVPAAAQDDAYRDGRARELVRLARERRQVVDTRITAYHVTARERISARMSIAGTERLIFRRETASRIDWTRDTVRIEVIGARETVPVVRGGVDLPPASIARSVPALAFDPVDSEMLLRFDSTVIRHPLAPGSEAFYRFASGDSLSVRIPGGRSIRILELRITARRPDPQLINGSFWLDSETHAVVRAGFRLSRGFSSNESAVNVLMPEMSGELDHVALDYGLWEQRWWLPRSVVASGVVRVAGTRLPLSYQRSYEGYRIEGDPAGALPRVATTEAPARPCRPRGQWSITVSNTSRSQSERWKAGWDSAAATAAQGDTAGGKERCARAFIVTRADSTDLVRGPAFDASIYDEGEGPLSESEMESLTDLVRDLPGVPWGVSRPTVQLLTPELVRFNRVEGLALAARATLPLGPASVRGEARVGTTGEFGARLAGVHSTPALRSEVAAYRGIEAVQVASQPFSLASSASAFFLGRDENDYFRGTGLELRLAPAEARRQRWDARVFAERQERVRARSDLSVRGLFDSGFDARPNVAADGADQLGATLRLRAARGDDPSALRTRAELELHGETGDFSFARPVVRLGADGAIGGGVGFGLALTAGTGFGEIPRQRAWQIGGATSVRGHDPAALRGESVWLARAELTRGTPMVRVSVFGDAGWTGDSGDTWSARPLRGAGVGVSMLDNLLRVDVARGIGGGGYRVHLRMGGSL
jgi:hypothetical protein